MKKVLSIIFICFLIIGTFVVGNKFVMSSAFAATASTTIPIKHEHHRELDQAIERLKAAKEDLEKVKHDLGGHRIKAIQAIDQALEEMHVALTFYKK